LPTKHGVDSEGRVETGGVLIGSLNVAKKFFQPTGLWLVWLKKGNGCLSVIEDAVHILSPEPT
jgi:hypothetical protein